MDLLFLATSVCLRYDVVSCMRLTDYLIQTETDTIRQFFQLESFAVPPLPTWINDERIQFWNDLSFHLHYLPAIALTQDLALPLWGDRPGHFFYEAIEQGKLEPDASLLPGKWILIDARDKPEKQRPWISASDVWILEKLGLHPKTFFKKKTAQLFEHEYLTETLAQRGYGSRFCLSVKDVDDLKPSIQNTLKLDIQKIRLPHFIEYNYLGNAFYPQWGTTQTWEWFEDMYDHGQHLAGGSGSLGAIGCDPLDYWSTILTFRPLIEL
ncbi:MAG: hypothetical protein WC654_02000 [Patescibacteria group bacterium]